MATMRGRVAAYAGDVADLILPRRCLGCAVAGVAWCLECQHSATLIREHQPDPCPAGFPPTVVSTWYADDARDAILAYKDRGRRDLRTPLAGLLAAAVDRHQPHTGAVLLPMPSTPTAARERGGDHLIRLARRTARIVGLPVLVGLGARPGVDAVGQDAAARLVNRRRTLYARRGLPDLVAARPVLLIDDLVTTGATLATAAELVRRAGASEVVAACIAATERQVTGTRARDRSGYG